MAIENGEWLVPFQGRDRSGPSNQNFLWKFENVYVMDNHRAALWCWLQELDLTAPHSLMHIDRHYDARGARCEYFVDLWFRHLPKLDGTIREYLDQTYTDSDFKIPVIVWDNYLTIYLEKYEESINQIFLLTHDDGDRPKRGCTAHNLWDLPDSLAFWLNQKAAPWIVNIDIDYFCAGDDENCITMASDTYLDKVAAELKEARDAGHVGVVTIALTPDSFTPGWSEAERLARRLLKGIGIDFCLPSE